MKMGRYTIALLLVLVVGVGGSRAESGDKERFVEILRAEDSLSNKLLEYKRLYHTFKNSDSTALYRQYILDTEQEVFDIRAQKSQLHSQLGDITLTLTPQPEEETTAPNSTTPEISKNLRRAYADARLVELKARGYISNYNTLARLSEEYEQSQSQHSADSIATLFGRVDSLNYTVAEQILSDWQGVLDNKNFAYALLIEQRGATALFDKQQQFQIEGVKMVDSLMSETHDEAFLNYHASLRWMSEFEAVTAQELQLTEVTDSLRYIRDSLRMVAYDFAPLHIEERTFIDYEAIKFSAKSIYTASNPIPALKLYDRGLIYRLLVGSFKVKQSAAIFRGTSPIGFLRNKAGLYSYYIGGYATLEEAEEARKALLKRGFRRPEVVEFLDGVSHNVTQSPRPVAAKYRVEIDGISEIPSNILSVIKTQGDGHEVVKTGAQSFAVGVFENLQSATRLSESLKIVDDNIKVSLVEVK